MYILLILSFIFTGCLGVFFYIQLKEKEDDIEELYDLIYGHIEEDNHSTNVRTTIPVQKKDYLINNSKNSLLGPKKGKVICYDKCIY